ncbi:MAG: AAA family ATPase, partial [Duganella sp.]
DDFGREAKPKVTYLRYHVALKFVPASSSVAESIDLVSESLTFIPKSVALKTLGFDMSKEFFTSIYQGSSKNDFLYMDEKEPGVVNLRPDQAHGQPVGIPIGKAWRTVLSHINTIDRPTALAARREIQSWNFLELEASSLRKPDDFHSESIVSSTGGHLPSALDRIKKSEAVAHRLATLLPNVADVFVDVDEKRQLKTLYLKTTSGMQYEARALSEGTLRFLALAIIAVDTKSGGLLCLEEPENGIHPGRMDAVVELLHEMAVDASYPVGDDNPLRQVIINTHSPLVVERLKLDNLVVSQPYRRDGASLSSFSGLQGTWRDGYPDAPPSSKPLGFGAVMAYLVQNELVDESRSESQNIRQEYLQQVAMMVGGEK